MKEVIISGKPSAVIEKLKAETAKDKTKINAYTLNLSEQGKLSDNECSTLAPLFAIIRSEKLSIQNIDLSKTTVNNSGIGALKRFLSGGEIGKGTEHMVIPPYKISGKIIGISLNNPETTSSPSNPKPVDPKPVEFQTLDTPTVDNANSFFKPEDAQVNQNTRSRSNANADIDGLHEETWDKIRAEVKKEMAEDETLYRAADSVTGLNDEYRSLIRDLKTSTKTAAALNKQNENNNNSPTESSEEEGSKPGSSPTLGKGGKSS